MEISKGYNTNSNFQSNSNDVKQYVLKQKVDTIKVCIRVRPLLIHEDVEFWVPDTKNNTISTAR